MSVIALFLVNFYKMLSVGLRPLSAVVGMHILASSTAFAAEFAIKATPIAVQNSVVLSVNVQPDPSMYSQPGSFYIAARLPNNIWFYPSATGWQPWDIATPLPAYQTTLVQATNNIDVTPFDSISAAGAVIYAGYGSTMATMLKNNTYNSVYVVPGNIGTASFISQPRDVPPAAVDGGTLPAIKVQVIDQNGQIVAAPIEITMTIGNQQNSGIYTGLLGGVTKVKTVNGVATFDALTVSQVGNGYTLMASGPGVTPVTSASFNVTPSIAGLSNTSNNGTGFEILNLAYLGPNFYGAWQAYLDYGTNPINSTAFSTWFQRGFIKNTPRIPSFDYAKTLGSPSTAPGSLTPYTDSYGYTWGYIAQVQNYDWPFNPSNYSKPQPTTGWQAGSTSSTVPAGVVKYNSTNKNQILMFSKLSSATQQPILRYFIEDQWGNMYIMKSTNDSNSTSTQQQAAFNSAILPMGWKKSTGYLSQDLFVYPVYGGSAQSMFLEFRDSGDNAYSQIRWSQSGDSIAEQAGSPMPLWASSGGARVNGTNGDDLMYGSAGNDWFYPQAGMDSIDGGGGTNVAYINGMRNQYQITNSNGTTTIQGAGTTKTLANIQYIKFSDSTVIVQ